jgi:glycogen operon protein
VRRRGLDTLPDIQWFTPDGTEMTEEDWGGRFGRAISVYLNGQGIPDTDLRGQRVVDDSFMLCFSGHTEPIEFHLPTVEYAPAWRVMIDTMVGVPEKPRVVKAEAVIAVGPRALVVLQAVT